MGGYRSFLYDLLHDFLLPCERESLFLSYDIEELLSMLDMELTEKDLAILQEIKRDNQALKSGKIAFEDCDITAYCSNSYKDKKDRNEMILRAYDAGIKQCEIAKLYGLSVSSVS